MIEIIVITCNIDVFTNPTLRACFEEALFRGYSVSVFMPEQIMAAPLHLKKLSTYPLHTNSEIFPKSTGEMLTVIKSSWYAFRKRSNTVKNVVIAVDPEGLCIASRLSKLINTSLFGYLSFEIIFRDEIKDKYYFDLKQAEIKSSKQLDFVIVQDKQREDLLKSENSINDSCRYFNIPVAPSDKYRLPPTVKAELAKYRVVFSGTLAPWSGVDSILDCINKDWNPDFHVEFHSRYKLDVDNLYRQKIDKMCLEGLPVSLHDEVFIDDSEYYSYIRQFDIGLALYFPFTIDSVYTGKNIDFIGLASGKFSMYMMMGIPTITTFNSVYKSLNDDFRFGYVMNSVDELPLALAAVSKNYREHRNGCLKLYDEKLNPKVMLDGLFDYIDGAICQQELNQT